MKPSLFYNYHHIGDVLIIVINPFLDMTKTINNKDVTIIYHDDTIIGINIFNISRIIKIHHQGLIVSPIKPLIDVINNILKNHDVPLLEFNDEPSFIVGEIKDIKNDIYFVDINLKVVEVKSSNAQLKIGDKIIYIKENTMCPNATISKNSLFGTRKNLLLDDEDEILILNDDNLIGQDFYSGEVTWNN